ncbi:MAG: peptidylprolyl isomerase [Candidatus Schekmanbacteria bacterium]|nr:peptidylprolyl isomerase [Candidatus Schekmanbacteria bacterium]
MSLKSTLIITLTLFLLWAAPGCSKKSTDLAKKETTPESVATVNGQAISKHNLDRVTFALRKQKELSGIALKDSDRKEMEKAALKRLIDLELLYQESVGKKIAVTNEDLDKAVKQIKSQFPDEKAFQQAYKEMNSSEPELREDLKRNLAIDSLIKQEILAKTEVSEKEAQDLYQAKKEVFKRPESVQISHILIKLANAASAEEEKKAKTRIEDIEKRLKKGEDFAKLAKENSECPSAEKGGDLGFIVRGQMVSDFEESAFKLNKTGEISPITRTSFGFHLLKRGEKTPEKPVAFEEARENIIKYLKNSKVGQEIPKYIQTLYAKAAIKSEIEYQKPEGEAGAKTTPVM